MRLSDNIRKQLAFVLLLLFTVSIAPKVLFHEVLADHTDGLVCQDVDKSTPHLHQPAFHCSFDELVVSSPYLFTEFCSAPQATVFALPARVDVLASALSAPFLHCEGRGPPLT